MSEDKHEHLIEVLYLINKLSYKLPYVEGVNKEKLMLKSALAKYKQTLKEELGIKE